MVLAGTLIVGGCGQKAADSTAATARVTETSDSAPADKPDGAPGDNSDKPGNPPDGAPGSMDGSRHRRMAGTEVRRSRRPGRTECCSDILSGSLKLLHRY